MEKEFYEKLFSFCKQQIENFEENFVKHFINNVEAVKNVELRIDKKINSLFKSFQDIVDVLGEKLNLLFELNRIKKIEKPIIKKINKKTLN